MRPKSQIPNHKFLPMPFIEYVGFFGAFLSAITFIPQVLHAYKTKRVGDLSWGMLWIVFTSVIVWLVYGFVKDIKPVVIANSIILILSAILLYFKATFKKP
jgi:MtN3 and saliva related transmembrane protein